MSREKQNLKKLIKKAFINGFNIGCDNGNDSEMVFDKTKITNADTAWKAWKQLIYNQKNIPKDFAKVINDDFWDIL